MGLRFRKTIRVGKFFRINLSKSGVGASAGIPGTGLSYGVSPKRSRSKNGNGGAEGGGCFSLIIKSALLILLVLAGLMFYFPSQGDKNDRRGQQPSPPSPATRQIESDRVGQPSQGQSEASALADAEKRSSDAREAQEKAKSIKDRNDRALVILKMGTNLEGSGKPKPAIENYRRVVKDFPGTPAAAEAAKRIEALKGK